MAASEVTTIIPTELDAVNKDVAGKNLVVEVHEVTFDSDKTVEVDIAMTNPKAMYFCEKNGAVSTTAYHLGTDLVMTSGKVTVSTIGNNVLTFIVTFIGYK